jgi:hypothetical protein
MSVVTNKYEDHSSTLDKKRCVVCKESIYRPPFLEWHGSVIVICGKCCHTIKRGFIADLMHAAAIHELQEEAGYRGETLTRCSIEDAEARTRKSLGIKDDKEVECFLR